MACGVVHDLQAFVAADEPAGPTMAQGRRPLLPMMMMAGPEAAG